MKSLGRRLRRWKRRRSCLKGSHGRSRSRQNESRCWKKRSKGKKERRMHSFSKKNRPDCGKHRWRRFRLWISARHYGNRSIPRQRSCLGTGQSLERCETRCGLFRNPAWSCRSVMQRFGRSIRLSMRTVSRYGRLFWMHRQAFWHSSWSKESPVRSVVRKVIRLRVRFSRICAPCRGMQSTRPERRQRSFRLSRSSWPGKQERQRCSGRRRKRHLRIWGSVSYSG